VFADLVIIIKHGHHNCIKTTLLSDTLKRKLKKTILLLKPNQIKNKTVEKNNNNT
jgi:hypothetical protein